MIFCPLIPVTAPVGFQGQRRHRPSPSCLLELLLVPGSPKVPLLSPRKAKLWKIQYSASIIALPSLSPEHVQSLVVKPGGQIFVMSSSEKFWGWSRVSLPNLPESTEDASTREMDKIKSRAGVLRSEKSELVSIHREGQEIQQLVVRSLSQQYGLPKGSPS